MNFLQYLGIWILLWIIWYHIGKIIVILIMSKFNWKHFKEDWKDDEFSILSAILYIAFPITIILIIKENKCSQ